jgi:hypothetical protein
VQTVAKTHALNYSWRDPFGIRHRFIGRHVIGQIVFVDAPERSQERAQAGARTFTTVAVNLARNCLGRHITDWLQAVVLRVD